MIRNKKAEYPALTAAHTYAHAHTQANMHRKKQKTYTTRLKQEAQLPQRDHATRYVSRFVLRCTSCGSYKCFKQQSDHRGHSRALAVVPFG